MSTWRRMACTGLRLPSGTKPTGYTYNWSYIACLGCVCISIHICMYVCMCAHAENNHMFSFPLHLEWWVHAFTCNRRSFLPSFLLLLPLLLTLTLTQTHTGCSEVCKCHTYCFPRGVLLEVADLELLLMCCFEVLVFSCGAFPVEKFPGVGFGVGMRRRRSRI